MKTHDLVAVTGTYMKDGEEKKRYMNVGAVIDKGNGPFIILEGWFNPAGVAKDGAVLLSMYAADSQKPTQKTKNTDVESDEIPF